GHREELLEVVARGILDADETAFQVADVLRFVELEEVFQRGIRHGTAPSGEPGALAPGGQPFSLRKYSSQVANGVEAARPRPQIEVTFITPDSARTVASTWGRATRFWCSCSAKWTSCWQPSRHGTHLPHDSFSKNCRQLRACPSIAVGSPGRPP